MDSTKSIFGCGLLLIVLVITAHSEDKAESKGIFSGSLNVGLNQAFLDLEEQRECTNCFDGAVDYDTEGVNLYKISGNLKVWGGSVAEIAYEQPFKKSDDQQALLATRKADETSYEKFVAGIVLDPFAKRFLKGESLSQKIYKRLLSLKYVFTREVFLGEVSPTSNAVFVPQNTTIDYNSSTIDNGTPITPTDTLTFKTTYTDKEISMGLFTFDLRDLYLSESVVRLGYYSGRWERLSDVQLLQLSATPIIYEAEFETEGILVSFQTTDASAPGINLDVAMKIGTNDSIKSALDWKQITNSDVDVQTLMVKFGGWYNYYFNKETKDGWSLSAGGSLDMRSTKVKTGSSFVESIPENENRDTIFKYFVSTGYRF